MKTNGKATSRILALLALGALATGGAAGAGIESGREGLPAARIAPILAPLAADAAAKVDPRILLAVGSAGKAGSALRAVGDAIVVLGTEPDDLAFPVLIRTTLSDAALAALGAPPDSRIGDIVSARLRAADLDRVASDPRVDAIEASYRMASMLDASIPESRANLINQGSPPLGYTGAGVLYGLMDDGIDVTHANFLDDQGKSRILYVWDHFTPGAPPPGYAYGVEYTKAEIDAGQAGQFINDGGHGSHVAGISVGDGSSLPNRKFRGVAPDADLIVVRNGGCDLFCYGGGQFSWGNEGTVGSIDGLRYMLQKRNALGRPMVVNQSQGTTMGPHDGSTLLEAAYDRMVAEENLIIVISAGNDEEAAWHGRRTVPAGGQGDFLLQLDATEVPTGIAQWECWYAAGDRFRFQLRSPAGAVADLPAATGPSSWIRFTFAADTLYFWSTASSPVNEQGYAAFVLQNRRTGLAGGGWSVRAIADNAVPQGGRIDLYCERNQERLRLTDGIATDMIIGMPGTCTNAITVASYNSKVEWQSIDGGSYRFIEGFALHDLSPFSSWGPRRDGALKPDLAAPGAAVVSVRADGYDPAVMSIDPSGVHAVMWGTSMAAPHVSGAIALMLQKDPSLTPAQIKSILLETARADQFTGAVPNARWGAGKLDVKAAVDAVGGGESCQTVPGDANADAAVNILDLVAAVNDILGTVPLAGGERACADVNQDAAIDVLDVVGIVNIILGKRAPEDLAARRTAELAARRDTRPAGPDIPATRGEGAAASTSAGPAAPVAWGRALDERGFRFRLDGREAAGLQMSFILPRGYRLAGAPEVAGAVPGVRVDHAERVGQHAVLLYNPAGGALAAGTAPVELLLPAVPDWDGGETIADLRVTRLTLAGVDGGELRLQEAPALGDGGGGSLPASLALQASPNPAAGGARIAYELGASGAVRIGVFDAAGRQVRVLWNGWQMAGAHVLPWDGRNDDGAAVGPGVYFVRVDTGREADSRKLIVLR